MTLNEYREIINSIKQRRIHVEMTAEEYKQYENFLNDKFDILDFYKYLDDNNFEVIDSYIETDKRVTIYTDGKTEIWIKTNIK